MVKVEAMVCGQSHKNFLKIRDLRITCRYFWCTVYKFRNVYLKSEKFVELEIKTSPTKISLLKHKIGRNVAKSAL